MSALLLDEPIIELWTLGSLEFVLRKFVMHSLLSFLVVQLEITTLYPWLLKPGMK